MCMDSFENCVKIDENSFKMGGNIGPKSRKSVPGGTPKWRQEAKMMKRGPSWERFLRKMASKMEAKIEKKSIKK